MDVDKDGLIDLLVGQKNGNTHLYLNEGSLISPSFTNSITDTLGGVFNYEPGFDNNAIPYIGKLNGDTNNVMIVGTYDGWLKFYEGLDNDFMGSFTLTDSIKVSGGIIAPAAANLNANDSLELVVGERSGGLISFRMDIDDYNYSPYPRDTCGHIVGVQYINETTPTFDLFPNPNNGSFTVRLNSDITGTGTLRIIDLSGKEIHRQNFSTVGKNEEFNLNQTQLKQGIYIVSIEVNNAYFRKKLIIQ
jgi:hypothetical protein